jgi:hypothetical protein
MSSTPDIVDRLIGVTDKYPGFRNLNTDAAAEITQLRSQVAALTAERDAMVEAASELFDTVAMHSIEPDGCYSRINTTEFDQSMTRLRTALNLIKKP